ncbi:MAG: epoxyqueuosine reductase [Chloroflexia bacterium]|nr:epoxyqueuosine reductase [Chloroflexia bacterium]
MLERVDAATVKELSRRLGCDKVGIAGPESFNLPSWTRSVIVLGQATLDEAWDYELYIAYEGKVLWSKPIYERLVAIAGRLALAISQAGCRAEPLSFEDSAALIDLRLAAVQAGLGTYGLNGLVVTREYGPRIRFGAVYTAAELEQDPQLKDYYCSSCSICVGACPDRALGPWGFDRSRCRAEFDPTPEMARLQEREQKRPSPAARLQCSLCISSCPIGKKVGRPFVPGLDGQSPAGEG